MILVAGYSSVYTAAQMLKRPPGGESGSVLYWMTGIDSLGAPKGGGDANAAGGTSGGGKRNAGGTVAKNNTVPGGKGMPTGRGTHSR